MLTISFVFLWVPLAVSMFGGVAIMTTAIHESGHWLAAKAFGFYVPIFSFGYGKPYRVIAHAFGTEFRYSWRWLIGSYVFFVCLPLTIEELAAVEAATGIKAPAMPVGAWWQRAIVYAAGSLANVLVACPCFILVRWLVPHFAELSLPLAVVHSGLLLTGVFNAVGGLSQLFPVQGLDGQLILDEFRQRQSTK